ncbi:MAG TPA: NAD(P)-dependent oxidoreductase [Kofleriaceae bacterium]|nr:NAD(P)-dependent oxidoreductase [Kofleriaceae bacterium]
MDIGIIGLGHMGQAMARSLLRGGHQVSVWNRSRDKAEPLRAAGAHVADALVDACRGDAVITMLSDDDAVEQVVCGPHGVLDALEPNRVIHVSMSTISPALVRCLAERHGERNQSFLSAPVLGRPAAAEQGELFVLAAGDADLVDVMRPAFDSLGQHTFVIGDTPEAANLVKVACNALVATIIDAVGETLALAIKAGIAPKAFLDVVMTTALGSPLYQPYGEPILHRRFEPGFRLPLALKDMELVLATGKELVVPMPIVSLLRDHLLEAIAAGDGDLDWAAMSLVPQREAGLLH